MHDIVVSDDFLKALAESGGAIRFLNSRGDFFRGKWTGVRR